MTKKVGRNDPCPCGSGKKYKKCCEQRLSPAKKKLTANRISGGGIPRKSKAVKISTDFFSKPPSSAPGKKLEIPRNPEDDKPHHPPEADKPM